LKYPVIGTMQRRLLQASAKMRLRGARSSRAVTVV